LRKKHSARWRWITHENTPKGEIAGIPCGTAKNKPKKNFALTREKQKKTPKSTKTPPKNNKNNKKQQKNTQKNFSR